ncbi:hypothetical protein [Hyunsoonleella rubra]|uniref:Intradiol ring-cleavage dioxygenases domain-containing protein n=1 Tax=Hyunsoonleella rubra TaxID=1737062 RepID=A0ABW5T9X5_9FLAO
MKKVFIFLVCICVTSCFMALNAQSVASKKDIADNYKKRHAIYDYSEANLNNTDTIPGFGTISDKLKISGTIYKSDGVTPASGVILYICQSDDYGNYHSKKVNGKRVLRHKGWIKTDADGKYTFYTFVPGTYWPTKALMEIHGVIKKPNASEEYAIEHFIFDNDPHLRDSCRKKIEKKGLNNILKLDEKDGMLIGKRDIVLSQNPKNI